ncbi:MAG: M20 family peptidase [Bacteroidales bacterium]|nr:M20 family peptidase [Bacteroidales bacterium]MCF8455195.1 M20 family peptidase [Bacteroidales bacterium]
MLKKILRIIFSLLLIIIAIILVRTFSLDSKQLNISPVEKIAISDEVANRLSKAIQIKTISYEDSINPQVSAFDSLHNFLVNEFPLVDSILEKEVINRFSLLYFWKGKNPDLKPAILCAHQDVVPVEEEKWDFPPFDGIIKDGIVHGRGSLDDKLSVLGILEATEILLQEGFSPERSWYFAFGHDEELMGQEGAMQIVEYLSGKGIEAEFILDEGLVVTEGMVPGIEKPVALIGITEKGYLTVELGVEAEGGHSSMPGKENAITILSKAISRIHENAFKPQISPPVELFLDYIGPEAPFTLKMASANRWLLEPVVIGSYQATAAGNALVTTTSATTIFKSGIKENVIPTEARAVINLRLLPGVTFDAVLAHFKKSVDDERVKIEIIGFPKEASPVASLDNTGYLAIEKTIRQVFPDAIVAPSLVLATTDSRHYTPLSANIYKFLPVQLFKKDIDGIHGINEKLSVEGYKDCIRFYYRLLKNGD